MREKFKFMTGMQRRWVLNSVGVALLVAVTALSAFTIALNNYFYSAMTSLLEAQTTTYAGFISKNFVTNFDTYYRNIATLTYEFTDRDKYELQFISTFGTLLTSTNSIGSDASFAGVLIDTPDVRSAVDQGVTGSWTGANPITGERVMSVSSPITLQDERTVGAVRCVTSLERMDRRMIQFIGISAAVCLLFILFIVSINLLFLRGILVPVREINSVSKRIAEGSYGARIEKAYKDEIGELVENINHMSGEIRAAERMKSDFISSVSHELRTPLTAISGWGETLLTADMSDPNEMRKGIRVMLKETSRLSDMVEELLDFTRIESGRMTLGIGPVYIASELEEIIYLHMDALKRDGVILTFNRPDEVPEISGDRDRLKQVFVNILDNAVKHGGGGKRIDAALAVERDWVVITIRDYGPGIPENELPLVKNRFYKGSTSARGSGIGLSISDEIMRLHGGELLIDSIEGEGATVTLRLPRMEEEII